MSGASRLSTAIYFSSVHLGLTLFPPVEMGWRMAKRKKNCHQLILPPLVPVNFRFVSFPAIVWALGRDRWEEVRATYKKLANMDDVSQHFIMGWTSKQSFRGKERKKTSRNKIQVRRGKIEREGKNQKGKEEEKGKTEKTEGSGYAAPSSFLFFLLLLFSFLVFASLLTTCDVSQPCATWADFVSCVDSRSCDCCWHDLYMCWPRC